MSDNRRVIPVTLDTVIQDRRVVTGTELTTPDSSQIIRYSWGEELLFQFTLFQNSISLPFAIPADATFIFGFDSVFTADNPDLCLSENDKFIAADWPGESGWNISLGRICCRASLTDTKLKTALNALSATTQFLTVYNCLWMLNSAGKSLFAQWSTPCYRVAVDPVTAVPQAGIQHVTLDQANASYVPKWGDQSRWKWNGTGWEYFFEDNKWREQLPRLVDGVPTIGWGEPKD